MDILARILRRKRKFDHLGTDTNSVPSGQCTEEKVCEDCLDIDFEGTFQIPDIRQIPYGVPVAELGKKTAEWGQAACPMCRLFAAVRVPQDKTAVAGSLEYHLRAYSFLTATNHLYPDVSLPEPIKMADIPCLLVLGGKGRGQSPIDGPQLPSLDAIATMISRGQSSGIICPVVSSATVFSPRFGTRRLLSNRIDYGLLQGWYQFCEQHHRETCATNSKDYPEKLKVIDCQARKIVASPPGCLYVALSYVWGQQQSTTTAWFEKPCRKIEPGILFPDTIPSVINDAMTVALELGWQYLWVDRYCIDQDDEAKHVQINQMDKVYSSAVITIIAAAGDKASYGLPGVSSISRKAQPYAEIRGRLLASTMRSSQETIGSSRWATRGWTYQETALSKRRLVFTEEQVFYECKRMSCCEAISVPLGLLHCKTFEDGFRSTIGRGYFEMFAENPRTRLDTYAKFAKQVEQFTARELSYEKDSLNAFIGVLNYYTNGQGPESIPFHTHMGLPCNAESSSVTEAGAYPPQLFRSLLWEHKISLNRVPPKRRPEYPSYSWAGWAGVATLPRTQQILLEHSQTMLHIGRDPGTTSDVLAPLGATIDFETYVVQGQAECSEDPDSNEVHTKFHLTVLGKGRTKSVLLPNEFLSRHNYSGGSQVFLVDFLFMGYSGGYGCACYFMLIEHHEGKAERLGVTSLNLYEYELPRLRKTRRRIRLG